MAFREDLQGLKFPFDLPKAWGPWTRATVGQVWPQPQVINTLSDYMILRPHIFQFRVSLIGRSTWLQATLIWLFLCADARSRGRAAIFWTQLCDVITTWSSTRLEERKPRRNSWNITKNLVEPGRRMILSADIWILSPSTWRRPAKSTLHSKWTRSVIWRSQCNPVVQQL